MPKNKTSNHRITEMMDAALQLRARKAPLSEAKRVAKNLYPDDSSTDASHRSRLLRLYRASDDDIQRAATKLKQGGNLTEVIAEIPSVSGRGAPIGNDNGKSKRQKPIIEDLDRLWALADMDTRSAFMRAHRLTRK